MSVGCMVKKAYAEAGIELGCSEGEVHKKGSDRERL